MKKYKIRYWDKLKNKDAGVCLNRTLSKRQADQVIKDLGKETKQFSYYMKEIK